MGKEEVEEGRLGGRGGRCGPGITKKEKIKIERTNCLAFMCVLECVWLCVTDAYNPSLHQHVCVAFACMHASRDDLLRDVVAARDLTTGLVRFVELQLKYLHSFNRRDFGLSPVTQ